MPSIDTSKPISWADQVEEGEIRSIPPPEEILEDDSKKLIEYKRDDDGKLTKIVRTFKIEKRKASKSVAHRKQWPKYGQSADDPPGPNPGTTAVVHDEILMNFVSAKDHEENKKQEESEMEKLKARRIMVCRVCKGDHWTTKCPYKESLEPLQMELLKTQGEGGEGAAAPADSANADAAKPAGAAATTGKYIPPSAREGARRGKGETMNSRRDEAATIRVTNLSEDTRDSDLEDLFKPFGAIQRIYLAQDKLTGQSKGFAFINFFHKESAAKAIRQVSGFGYDHLILKVEWAKPSGEQHKS